MRCYKSKSYDCLKRFYAIKIIDKLLIIGISERLPSANNIPRGKAKTIPTNARVNVSNKPPHSLASDLGIPKTPPPTNEMKKIGNTTNKISNNHFLYGVLSIAKGVRRPPKTINAIIGLHI